MTAENEYRNTIQPECHSDAEATAHELLNRAIEWQQYIRGISEFIADQMYEDETVKGRHVAIALEAISSLAKMGVECTMQAHSQMCREQLRLATAVGAGMEPPVSRGPGAHSPGLKENSAVRNAGGASGLNQ